jgi:hypothetical protein
LAEEIAAALAPLGLTGAFLPKRPAPPERFGAPPDGVALFYRPERLDALEGPRGAPYVRPASGGGGGGDGPGGSGGGPMTQGYMLATLADRRAGGRPLVVAGTHLKAKEGGPNDETRRLQATQLLEHVSKAAAAAASAAGGKRSSGGGKGGSSSGGRGRPGVLIMGDFNATPASSACQVGEAVAGAGAPGLNAVYLA